MTADITIVGLGPGDPGQITLKAWQAIEGASEVYLRTEKHPIVAHLPTNTRYRSFDHVYESLERFEDVYAQIAAEVIALGQRPGGVVYAVPGNPLMGETTVVLILAKAEKAGLSTQVIPGMSFLEPAAIALGIDPFEGLQICDATTLAHMHHPNLDPDVAALIVQVYSRPLAAEAKMTLMNLYHDDHPVRLVRAAGTPDEQVREFPLYELDRQHDLDHLSSLYVPALPFRGSLSSFQDIVARLRAPGGCPWDRKQTHQSLRNHLLEETYEVLDALDADDRGALREELGDLMLQILLHTQIAVEEGDFRLADCCRHIIEKLVRRHPHVFAGDHVSGADQVLRNWEQIKRAERESEHDGAFASMLAGIPGALPALSRAMEMQKRAARVGFDWPNVSGVTEKIKEELGEFLEASGERASAAEIGDLLFSLVNLARWYRIDAESALREANQRFARRFAAIERVAHERGVPLEEMSLEEMDALWEQAKGAEDLAHMPSSE